MSNRVRYAETPWGRLGFQLDSEGVVWVHSKTHMLGGWSLERFGGELNAAGIRRWVQHVNERR